MERVRSFGRYICGRAPSQKLFTSEDNPLSAHIRQCAYCSVLFTNETEYSKHRCWGSPKMIAAVIVLLVLLWKIDTSTNFQIYKQAYQSIYAPRYLTDKLGDVVMLSQDDSERLERKSRVSIICKNLTSNLSILPDQTEYLLREIKLILPLIGNAIKIMKTAVKPASNYEPILIDEKDHRIFGNSNKTHQRIRDLHARGKSARLFTERARKILHRVLNRFRPSHNKIDYCKWGDSTEYQSICRLSINTIYITSTMSSINGVCEVTYEAKDIIEKDLSFLEKRLRPYIDLEGYYMEERQNRQLKLLLLAQNYFRIYASVLFTYFQYMVCGGFILHIWRIVGLWIYTQIYRIIMNQKWVWKSRIANMVCIWLAMTIDYIMKANESCWRVFLILRKPFDTLFNILIYGSYRYVLVETRLTIPEFTNITSQELKINKGVKKKLNQHNSYQRKNKYDKTLDKQDENNNLKALIELKYLQRILKNTRAYYYETLFSPWVQGEIEIFETDKKQRLEFYENNSQVTKELSISCIHSFTEKSLKEVVELFKNVMTSDATNCVNQYQLMDNEDDTHNKLKEYNIIHHNTILTLVNALLHISPKQYQQIQKVSLVRFSDQYEQAWFLTKAAMEYEETCNDSDESSEATMRLTIVKLSAAVKGLIIHDNVNQRHEWKTFIIGDIERLLTMLDSLENWGHDSLSLESKWQDVLKIIIYHSALFLNKIEAANKCLNLFGSDNSVGTCDYQSLLIDIQDSWSHYTGRLSLLNGGEDARMQFSLPYATDVLDENIGYSPEPWWLIWKATIKAPPVVDSTSQNRPSGADVETNDKTKTDTQYLRELPETDIFKNGAAKFQAIYATVEAGTHNLICLLAKPIGTLLSSQLEDTWEYKKKDECTESAGADDTILHTKLRRGTSYHARKFIYCALTDEWMYSNTIISIDDQIDIETTEKGKQRDVVRVSLRENNQPHVLKINREPKLHHVQMYFSDIRTHQFSRYYVDLFTKITQDRYIRLRMLDAVHIQILENANGKKVMDYGNAELSMEGYKFVKFSNNTGRVNEKLHTDLREIATAFSHFTHHHSQGALMVVDLQGWIRITNDDVEIMLTDPAINCPDAQLGFFGFNNWGQAGFDKFWTGQHRKCNKICKKLGLVRPKKILAGFLHYSM